MTPRVSVVVPAYNNGAYIGATLQSILGQTFADFELVVADHASTDDTAAVVSQFADDSRLRVIDTPAGGGVERNWNRVTEAASGELIKLVCGDDVIYPDLLAQQVSAFDSHGDGLVMVASSRDIVDAAGRTIIANVGLGGLSGRIDGRRALRRSVLRGATSSANRVACCSTAGCCARSAAGTETPVTSSTRPRTRACCCVATWSPCPAPWPPSGSAPPSGA